MSRYVCGGWTAENSRWINNPQPICNHHVNWSYQESDGLPGPTSMDEIPEKEYEEIVKLCGVRLFNGAPVDKNPKSIEEGYYDDYKIINLYKKKKGVIGYESSFDDKEYYELIQSKEFPSFWNAIRALHFFELPLEWKEMNFEGHSVGIIYHLPDYKLELVKE
jgi:hypothetical protein